MAMYTILDGLDNYTVTADLTAKYSTAAAPQFNSTAGRFGGGALLLTTDAIGAGVDGANTHTQQGAAVKIAALADCGILAIKNTVGTGVSGTELHAGLIINSNGGLSILNDAGTVVASSANGLIQAGQFYYIEFRVFRNASGTAEGFINGTSVVSYSGDTIDSSSSVFTVFFGSTGTVTMDDIYSYEGTAFDIPVGDKKITTIRPNADTAQADWSLSTGVVGYDLVDDTGAGDGDTGYLFSNTVGHKSEFDMTTLSATSPTIYAVAVGARAKKTDAGAKTYRCYLNSGGTVGNGGTRGPADTGYTDGTDVFTTDPNTAVAWTKAGIDALKVGIEILS